MGDAQVGQHLGPHAILPGVHRKPLLEVGVHGVQSLVLKAVGPQLVADADTPTLMSPQVDHYTSPLGPDLGQGGVKLGTTVAAQGSQQVSGQALGVDPDQRGVDRAQVAQHVGHVLVLVQQGHVSVGGPLAVLRGDAGRTEVLDQLLMASTVANQVGNGDELQLVLGGENLQVGQAGHGAVIVDDLAQHPHRLPIGQRTQVDGSLGVSSPLEHAAHSGP